MKTYIAYGSNMDVSQMSWRCPNAKLLGTGILHNWKLCFKTHADIMPDKGNQVPVLVWSISPEDESALDLYEGYPDYYRKETVDVTLASGKTVSGMVYVMNSSSFAPPYPSYLKLIFDAYRKFGFHYNPIFDALEELS